MPQAIRILGFYQQILSGYILRAIFVWKFMTGSNDSWYEKYHQSDRWKSWYFTHSELLSPNLLLDTRALQKHSMESTFHNELSVEETRKFRTSELLPHVKVCETIDKAAKDC